MKSPRPDHEYYDTYTIATRIKIEILRRTFLTCLFWDGIAPLFQAVEVLIEGEWLSVGSRNG
jgi:hypothetical protein